MPWSHAEVGVDGPDAPCGPVPRVGVLAVQGDVAEHLAALRRCGAEAVTVRRESELDSIDALVLPGGESSAIDRLLRAFDLDGPCASGCGRACPPRLLRRDDPARRPHRGRRPRAAHPGRDGRHRPPQRLRPPGRQLRDRPGDGRPAGARRCTRCSSGRPRSCRPGRAWRCSPRSRCPGWGIPSSPSGRGRCSPPPSTPRCRATTGSTGCSSTWPAGPRRRGGPRGPGRDETKET